MKAAIVVLLCVPAFVLLAGCAAQVVAPPAGVCIPPEVMRQCAREGGCTLFSRVALEEMLGEAAQSCKGKL